jgi:ABC-type Fe3+/spermidine/putrescine transport system ATPase subunit
LTVAGNIAFGPSVKGWDRHKIKSAVLEALKLVQLEGFADRTIESLSGGQQQRVAIARAIINKPEVLLLDEPLSALDRKLREQMQIDLLRIQRSLGITFILVTHDQEEALTMSDKIAIMKDGVVEQFGNPQDIYCRPQTKFVADFIGSVNSFSLRGEDIVIRPEDLKISGLPFEPSSVYGHALDGRVRELLFKGAVTDAVLDVIDDCGKSTTLIAQMISGDQNHFEVGQHVFLRWPKKSQINLNA